MIANISTDSSQNLSLTPGFSPVLSRARGAQPFQRLPRFEKPLKRLGIFERTTTGLKPGANEI